MIWARWAGVMGVPMKWEIARIFVVGTGGSGFCAEAAPSGVIGFFMAVAPYVLVLVSPRRFKQILNLRVEVSGYRESCLSLVGCKEARHRVVSEMHSVCAFVHQDCYRSV